MKGHHSGKNSTKADTIRWVAEEVTKCVHSEELF